MKKDLIPSLAWAGGLVGLALAASLARKLGYIDAETVTRMVMAAIGLMVAWIGNRTPKAFVPSAVGRRVNRVAGWSLAVSGLINTGLWLFGPLSLAMTLGTGVIAAGVALTVAYCLSLRARPQA